MYYYHNRLAVVGIVFAVLVFGCERQGGRCSSVYRVGEKSFETVRDAIRADRANGKIRRDEVVEVVVADGTYVFPKTLELDERDSRVRWRAEHSGKVVISGAVELENWKTVSDPAVLTRLQPQVRGKVWEGSIPNAVGEIPSFASAGLYPSWGGVNHPVSLFLGDRRLPCARWPNGDEYAHTGESGQKDHVGWFKVVRNDRLTDWVRERSLWAFGMWQYEWADFRLPVIGVDPTNRIVKVDAKLDWFGFHRNRPYFVFNALCEMDEEGEWVLDRQSRKVYVLTSDVKDVRMAWLRTLIEVKGARNVTFAGLMLKNSREVALRAEGCEDVRLEDMTVAHIGGDAVEMTGVKRCVVANCEMFDLGEGGVCLQGGDRRTLTKGENVVESCHIHHYGQYTFNYRPAVRLEGVGNVARKNLIHHARHNGITFGGNDHYVAFNVIHDTCSYNDDAGAIYCCARDYTQRGTVIEYNVVHWTGKSKHPCHCDAIYIDDFSSGIVVRGNIINRATRGVHIGGGQDNLVTQNVIMNCLMSIHLDSRLSWDEGRKANVIRELRGHPDIYGSELWAKRYPRMGEVAKMKESDPLRFASLYNVISNNVIVGCSLIAKDDWAKVKSYNLVTEILSERASCDDLFVDYEGFDWRIKDAKAKAVVGELPIGDLRGKMGVGVTNPPKTGFEYMPAAATVYLYCEGKLPEGVHALAMQCEGCEVPGWSQGKRVAGLFGHVGEEWEEFSFSFVPTCDLRVRLDIMGARGAKTLYDDFRATGIELKNGGFETGEGWSVPSADPDDARAPYCDLRYPFGILDECAAGCRMAEGKRAACGNDMLMFSQDVWLTKGKKVTITFKARALD